jgi:hypothetical protein
MKRPLFIIIGAIIVLILLVVWLYVLFFSDPRPNNDTFADLNFPNQEADIQPATDPEEQSSIVNVGGAQQLRQLTTSPVIGYQEVWTSTTSDPMVYYVEAGTGYIRSINLTSGEEVQLSGTTVANAVDAAITPNGRYILMQSGTGRNATFIVGEISTSSNSIITQELPARITDFVSTSDNTFLLAARNDSGLLVDEHFPADGSDQFLFEIPFQEAAIAWGKRADSPHVVYPKASHQLQGYLYRAEGGTLTRLPADGYGLSATINESYVLYSKQDQDVDRYRSYKITSNLSPTPQNAPIAVIPEKCAPLAFYEPAFVCAATPTEYDETTPDSWYQGTARYADSLWQVDLLSNNASQLVNITNKTGREVDVYNIKNNGDDARFYFTNRLDRTLWVYYTQPTNQTPNSPEA